MNIREKSPIQKFALVLVSIAGLALVSACASDPGPSRSDYPVAKAPTSDPLGPPGHIKSDVGREYPSSVAGGAGNAETSGTNTNLNPKPRKQPKVTITETPIVEEEPAEVVMIEEEEPAPVVVAEAPEIVEVEPEPVRTTTTIRTTTKKE